MIDSETVGVGGKKQERLLLLMPKFSGSHREQRLWHHSCATRWLYDSLEHCRRTFKHLTVQIIFISWSRSLWNEAKQIFMEFQHCSRCHLSSIRDVKICQCRWGLVRLPWHFRLMIEVMFWVFILWRGDLSRRYLPAPMWFWGLKSEQRTLTYKHTCWSALKPLY